MENMKEEFDLAKWLAGEMSESELAAFEKTPEYAAYAKIKKYSAQLEAPVVDEKKLYGNITAGKQNPKGKVIPLYVRIIRVAAVLVLFLGLGYFAMTVIPTTETAQNAHTTSFLLPDDSQVVLNAGSEINYKKWDWDNHRNLQLEGEAFFKVAKGKKFEVVTSLGKVTVLGTQFIVKSRNGRFDVSCYEGRVKVDYNNTEVIITKGQSVAFAEGNAIDVPANNGSGPEWLNHKLAFNRESLQNIIDELSRQYAIQIELKGVSSSQLFTGVLPLKNLDEAIQIVASTYHLAPKKEKGKIILEAVDAQN